MTGTTIVSVSLVTVYGRPSLLPRSTSPVLGSALNMTDTEPVIPPLVQYMDTGSFAVPSNLIILPLSTTATLESLVLSLTKSLP